MLPDAARGGFEEAGHAQETEPDDLETRYKGRGLDSLVSEHKLQLKIAKTTADEDGIRRAGMRLKYIKEALVEEISTGKYDDPVSGTSTESYARKVVGIKKSRQK